MIGKTAEDPWGLFRYPLDALCHAGVDTSFVRVLPREAGRLPGIALIPVDRNGCNQIYVLPGVNDEFGPEDVRLAEPLFSAARANRGFLVLSLECPFPTVLFARKLAREHQLRTLLDPGGMSIGQSYDDLLACGLFLIKPNRHETSLLTGIEVTDMPSARRAAERLFDRGIQNVMITMGEQGAYLFQTDGGQSEHIPAPSLLPTSVRDETGCGDQTLAALVAAIHSGKSMSQAARIGVTAGTWQYTRLGIDPLDRAELNLRLENDLKLPEPRDQP
jgi:ribokinase